MRVSEITTQNLANYLRLEYKDSSDAEKAELEILLGAAKAYIKSYTGLTDEEIDTHEDFIIVVYILVQDMYDNRVLYVHKSCFNKVVSTILDMHSVNLL